MTYWRWVRRAEGAGWVETDKRGNSLPGAKLQQRVPKLEEGDQMSAEDVARQARQLRDDNRLTVAERVERTKEAISSTPTIRTGDRLRRSRKAVAFEDRLASTRAALNGEMER